MTRATWALAGTTLIGLLASIWLYLDNRSLRSELTDKTLVAKADNKNADGSEKDAWLDANKTVEEKGPRSASITPMPSLPNQPKLNRNDRRAQRTMEFTAMFGRQDGETEDEYRQRVMPMITGGMTKMRDRTAEMRKAAEEKAKVTPEQSAKLDKAFEKVYSDVIDYTNNAVADGKLSPYERNVANMLDFAGGLGGMLNEVQGQIGKILDPGQMKAIYDSGFEWGEYLGANAPWEKLKPPPPKK